MTKKVTDPDLVTKFDQIPNVGKSTAEDFRLLGLKHPRDLAGLDPYELYVKLCKLTECYQDPCVVDVFIAATRFMAGKANQNWWAYTEERKRNFERVRDRVEKYK